MNGITRYVLRQTLGVMLFVTVSFTAAVWLVQSLRLIDLIVNRGLSLGLFLYLAVLILPRFIDVVLPIAVFIAILFTYNRLLSESELIVMRAAGMSQAALARPGLIAGGLGFALLMSFSIYFLPAAQRAFKDLQFEIRNRFASVLLQDGIFNTMSDDLTIYVRGRDTNGELVGLLIHETRDPDKPVTIVAERGTFVDTDSGPRVLMVNGSRQQYDRTTGKLSVLTFDKYTLDLSDARDAPGLRDREPDELFLPQLLFGHTRAGDFSHIIEANLRLINPLSALAFCMIPLACLLTGEFNRRGQAQRVLLAIMMAFLFETLDIAFKNLAGRTLVAVPLLYINVLAPIAGTTWLLWRDSRYVGPRELVAPPAPAE
ncbi:MAG TPA: LPS export ABC transporter permease LptF [Stellaceae bacterium]|jgi:lipopolysaccharide export system permease protein|nr:LPS export ABC transporter permease LptF [Stellaceae bacterium]